MNIAHSLPSTVSGVSFSFLTGEDVRRISVKQIVNVNLLDDLNRPNIGGLYDPALGPTERQDMSVYPPISAMYNGIYPSTDARHVASPSSPAPDILAISTSRHPFSTLYSWEICTTSCAIRVSFAIDSKLAGLWCVHLSFCCEVEVIQLICAAG